MKKLIFLMVVSFLSSGLAASAQNIPEKKPQAFPANEGIKNIMLARQLVVYGYKNSDGMSLLEAAKIYSQWNLQHLTLESSKTKSGKEVKELQDPFNIQKLISDALKFSGADPNVKKFADQLSSYVPKETRQSVFIGVYELDGLNALVLELRYKEDKSAVVVAEGDGNADIDLYIIDQYENVLARDEDESYKCQVNFYPKKDDKYYVMVVNRSTNPTAFAIATN
jgi:hypothetical protein